jgi:hypothetical protein
MSAKQKQVLKHELQVPEHFLWPISACFTDYGVGEVSSAKKMRSTSEIIEPCFVHFAKEVVDDDAGSKIFLFSCVTDIKKSKFYALDS